VTRLVLEHLDGLSPFVVAETGATAVNETEAVVDVADVRDALGWRTVVAAYESLVFDVARPRTLISPEHVARVADHVRALPSKFASFRVSAAGSDSEDMKRLRGAIAAATRLVDDPDDGELLIRLRKSNGAWEVLLRLTPRPLSARAWRSERYEGGLNATIAAAIIQVTDPQPTDRFLDMMCGSGTLLIERLLAGPAAQVVGYDVDPDAIAITKTHWRNAAIRGAKVDLRNEDVLTAEGEFDKIVVNPPWGTSVGSHDDNVTLYPALLATAARLAPRLYVLTHEITLFESALSATGWKLVEQHRFFQKGHWPRLYVVAS
jgi:tRNA (guanine6-N2)-methyltransferase